MPIIKKIEDQSLPLGQGDILKGAFLFSTVKTWDNGGAAKQSECPACLVLSRPCVAVRSDKVVVAAIDKSKMTFPALESFEECLEFFSDMRDGHASPDIFYLGQVESLDGVQVARLGELHTIAIPKGEADRLKFLEDYRIARLEPDFARDLHLRLFRSIASLGFEDDKWFTTTDLKAVVAHADNDVIAKQAELAKLKTDHAFGVSQGFHQGKEVELDSKIAKLESAIAKLQSNSKPFRDELASRS